MQSIGKNKESLAELDIIATGGRIKQFMDDKGVSIRELCKVMNVSFQSVYKWQKGESLPTVNNFYILGQVLGINIDDMLVAREQKQLVLTEV